MDVQNVIWGLLKLESFPKFRAETGKSMKNKVPTKTIRELTDEERYPLDIYEIFLSNNNMYSIPSEPFRPLVIPDDKDYNQHTHINLPPFKELWIDRDMMLAFRHFLYEKSTYENLSFYLHCEVFKISPEDQLTAMAQEIYDAYLAQNAKTPLNIDYLLNEQLNRERNNPHKRMYDVISDRIYKVLELEWYPVFITSDTYKSLNEETLVISRERSKTMDNYDAFIQHKNQLQEDNQKIKSPSLNSPKKKRRKKDNKDKDV